MQTAIALSNLHVSPLNMRAEKKLPTLKRMPEISANILPTVREKGILSDLIVRPNNSGFEILAGRRRYYAAKVIESERGEFPPLNCDVRENCSDAEALEISLIENVAREDADELAEYETYAGLIKLGKKPSEIAATFGIPEHKVTQRLALANLLPAIRDLYRSEELEPADLQLLTMATKTQQRDWLKLAADNDAPTGQQLKGWLFGGAAISTKFALFDLAAFQGKIVGDLFSEDGYFASADAFWTAQDEAIAARREAYLAAKWADVVVLERGAHFPQWDFVKASKKAGSRVFIEPTRTGEVRFHEGYLTQAEAARGYKKSASAEGAENAETAAPPRPVITKTMRNYLDLHRHAAVRLALLAQPAEALRLLIAHAVGMRERAAEIVTLDLGPRTDLEIEDRFARQVAQERLTDLDRALRRAASPEGEVSLADGGHGVARPHWAGRLQTLSRMGLAEEATPGHWRLSADLETTLRDMGERADIIKTMHREMAMRSMDRSLADLAIFGRRGDGAVTGRVVTRALSDTGEGRHYLLVDGLDGRLHYAEVPDNADGAVIPGAIVRLRGADTQQREVDQTVSAIAARNGGTYSAALHQAYDPQARPEFITAHVRRLEAMRRVAGLTERKPDGSWTIAKDHAERGAQFDADRVGAKVELLSPVPLDDLAKRRARTWLDQELVADSPTPAHDGGFGRDVQKALRQRRAWLIAEGLAREEAGRTFYRRDMLTHLQAQEIAETGAAYAGAIGKRYFPAAGGPIEGVYREPVQLVSGKFAVIEKARDFTLVPWRPVLDRELGRSVRGMMRGDAISWTLGRSRGQSIT